MQLFVFFGLRDLNRRKFSPTTDLAPSDYHLFGPMKKMLGGLRFTSDLEAQTVVREWLAQHHPDRAKHVMSLINQTRGGKDYDSRFGQRMSGTGPYAELLRTRFELARRKCGFDSTGDRHELRVDLFRPPTPDQSQLTLGF